MFNSLDLLIIVSLVMIAAGFLSLILMFLVRNKKVQRVCIYISVALSLYIGYVGIRINWLGFSHQAVLAVVLAIVAVGAFVLERIKKDSEKMFLYARIAVSAALIIGFVNALLV